MNKKVSFPIAKLLKDKGLEQNLEVGTICRIQNAVNKSYEKIRPIKQSDLENQWSIFNEVYPTIADVVMWLYEKYGIWIYIKQSTARLSFRFFIQRLKILGEDDILNDEKYNSPTEAYEAGIEYTLNHLI